MSRASRKHRGLSAAPARPASGAPLARWTQPLSVGSPPPLDFLNCSASQSPVFWRQSGLRAILLLMCSKVFSLCTRAANRLNSHRFVRWCNGNTAPFGGVIHGSNPCRTANFPEAHLRFAIEDFHALADIYSRPRFRLPPRAKLLRKTSRRPSSRDAVAAIQRFETLQHSIGRQISLPV